MVAGLNGGQKMERHEMTQEEIFSSYDAILTAEACGDYSAAFALCDKLNNKIGGLS